MSVKLVSVSRPVVEGLQTAEDLMVYCARVSNPSNQLNAATGASLLAYCIRHGHWSVFETASMTVEITTSRAIAAQILRHRSFSFQEFSQRYAVADLGFEFKETRLQDTKNRQNSLATDDPELDRWWQAQQGFVSTHINMIYNKAIELGIAKEQARAILPEGITTSRLYMQGTLRSWLHYIELRSGPETQKEHREVAQACANALETIFPMVTEFLVK